MKQSSVRKALTNLIHELETQPILHHKGICILIDELDLPSKTRARLTNYIRYFSSEARAATPHNHAYWGYNFADNPVSRYFYTEKQMRQVRQCRTLAIAFILALYEANATEAARYDA